MDEERILVRLEKNKELLDPQSRYYKDNGKKILPGELWLRRLALRKSSLRSGCPHMIFMLMSAHCLKHFYVRRFISIVWSVIYDPALYVVLVMLVHCSAMIPICALDMHHMTHCGTAVAVCFQFNTGARSWDVRQWRISCWRDTFWQTYRVYHFILIGFCVTMVI